jgi:hypothetical protein
MQPGVGRHNNPTPESTISHQSGTKNLASDFYIIPFFPNQSSRTLVITSTNHFQLCDWEPLHGSDFQPFRRSYFQPFRGSYFQPFRGSYFSRSSEVTVSRSTEVTFRRSLEVTFSRSTKDVTEVISIHRHTGGIPGYFVSGMMNDDM